MTSTNPRLEAYLMALSKTNLVNLDAMIQREDFSAVTDPGEYEQIDNIPVGYLGPGSTFFSKALRKPDFQRETSAWTPTQIAELVASFVSGDLVPAVILWKPVESKFIFVIDGAHRLSALMAWVNDDYGDRDASRAFFEKIPPGQEETAKKTRKLIDESVGSFSEQQRALQNPDVAREQVRAQSERLASLALKVQWVKGNADKAEKSFFTINQSATPIDETELKILRSRRLPNAIASRAIMRGGTGHQYWQAFDADKQQGIKTISSEIYDLMYSPPLKTPIKTLDLPIGGRPLLSLIFDFVNLVNNEFSQAAAKAQKGKRTEDRVLELSEKEKLLIDADGSKTVKYLDNARRLVQRITGLDQSSLGLHPAIYFYSAVGRHQQSAFIAISGFIKELHERGKLEAFTVNRHDFEEFLLANKDFVNQTVRKLGAGFRSFYRLKEFYHVVFESLMYGQTAEDILRKMEADKKRFAYYKPAFEIDPETQTRDYSSALKSAVFLREALAAPRERCNVCGSRMHVNSISIDHIQKRADGGLAILENGTLAHPYCNSIRDKLEVMRVKYEEKTGTQFRGVGI